MRRLIYSSCVASLFALACGDDAAPSPKTAAVATAKKAAPAAGVAAPTAPAYVYTYSPIGKRDPFRSMTGESGRGEHAAIDPESLVCNEPLCQSDLDDLNLVAVISGDANPVAMVEDKTNVGHIVRRNSKIGRQGGKVTSILRDCIVVTSFVQGPDGKAQPNRSNLCVKKEVATQPVLDLMQGKLRE